MSEINWDKAARGRVSLRRRRARASEGRFLCVLRVETGRRHDARLWLRGFAGLSIRDPCFERPPSRCRRALEGPVRVCSPGVVATVARAAVLGERRVTSRRRRARSTARSARTPAGAPDGRVKRLAAAAPTTSRAQACGPARVESVRDSAAASTPRRHGASVGRSARPRRSRKADTTLGCNSAFFSQWFGHQRSRLCLTRGKESLCGATRTRRASRRAPLRELTQLSKLNNRNIITSGP